MTIIENLAFGCIKSSVCLFYRRIFYVSQRFILFNNVVIALIFWWTLAFLLAKIFVCGLHPGVLWSRDSTTQGCANQRLLLLWFAITDVIGDIAVLSMPYPCIVKLQMNRREKLGISGVFLLGTLFVIPQASAERRLDALTFQQSISCGDHTFGIRRTMVHR